MRKYGAIVFVLLLTSCLQQENLYKPLTNDKPIIIAHRGASAYAPEHSYEAYDLAIAMKSDYIELDVQTNDQNELIVAHDDEQEGLLLKDVLQRYKEVCMYIEIKNPTIQSVAQFTAMLQSEQPKCAVIQSFEEWALADVQEHYEVIWLIPKKNIGQMPIYAKQVGINEKYITRQVIEKYHNEGIEVIAYTVNNEKRFFTLQRLGIDGVFTDKPDKMREIVWKNE